MSVNRGRAGRGQRQQQQNMEPRMRGHARSDNALMCGAAVIFRNSGVTLCLGGVCLEGIRQQFVARSSADNNRPCAPTGHGKRSASGWMQRSQLEGTTATARDQGIREMGADADGRELDDGEGSCRSAITMAGGPRPNFLTLKSRPSTIHPWLFRPVVARVCRQARRDNHGLKSSRSPRFSNARDTAIAAAGLLFSGRG